MSSVKDTSVSYVNVLYKRGNLNCFLSSKVLFIIYSDDLDGLLQLYEKKIIYFLRTGAYV